MNPVTHTHNILRDRLGPNGMNFWCALDLPLTIRLIQENVVTTEKGFQKRIVEGRRSESMFVFYDKRGGEVE